MSDDADFDAPTEPYRFRYIEAGMHLIHEFESIGAIETSLGHRIQFCPVLAVRGWSTHKEYTASLRIRHFNSERHEIGNCLVDQDEVTAWGKLIIAMLESDSCDEPKVTRFEYVTRNGMRLTWQPTCYLLHVASQQAAILPEGFLTKLLDIFNEFESFYNDQK